VLQALGNAEKIVYPMIDDLFATVFPVTKNKQHQQLMITRFWNATKIALQLLRRYFWIDDDEQSD
jgi:hypothetical protein